MSGHDPLALAEWQRIRRYAVPPRMIAECAEARARGDWRAACAAGRVDVDLTDARAEVAADALAGFAPDLLRWHLPRALGGHTTLATRTDGDSTLRYALRTAEPLTEDAVVLVVDAPVSVFGSQRLTLRAVPAVDSEALRRCHPVPPYRWDFRRAGDLHAAVYGSREPLPRPDDDALLPEAAFGARLDPPAPDTSEAWARAGLPVTVQGRQWWPDFAERRWHIDPVLLAREVREVAEWFGEPSWALWLDYVRVLRFDVDGDTIDVTQLTAGGEELRDLPRLHHQLLRHDVDTDLVRHGRLSPGDLHPLVRAALFPSAGATTPSSAIPPAPAGPVRVRCAGAWHEIQFRSGRLTLTAHSETEQQRERAMRAFGGAVTGCFAVEQTWNGTPGRLPKQLRAHREDLWQRMLHGGTRTVLELLDAGMDPHLRDGRGRTLLHRVRSFDHRTLLPRLLAEGLDVNARDLEGSTPLYLAVVFHAPADVIIALAEAGADVHAPNQDDMSVIDYLDDVLAYREDTDPDPDFAAAVAYLRQRA